jgi:hypothetical protein
MGNIVQRIKGKKDEEGVIMGGTRIPGPEGVYPSPPVINAETATRRAFAVPGPARGDPDRALSTGSAAVSIENDAEIEVLNLAGTARKAAYALKKAHPSIKFTSGRRNKSDQARAMASNVVRNRKWIEQTYASSELRRKCQEWVDNNPEKKTQAEIEEGLLSVLNAASDAELGKFSKHLSGGAFDVQPVEKDAEAIKRTIRGLPGLDKFLDTEGGLVRWHVQF